MSTFFWAWLYHRYENYFPSDRDDVLMYVVDDHNSKNVPCYIAIIWIFLGATLYRGVDQINQKLPVALNIRDEEAMNGAFIAQRARRDLRNLTAIGPRVTGSHENEELAVGFLRREIQDIIERAHEKQKIEMDLQVTSGSYAEGSHIYAYSNVQNVIVRIHSEAADSDRNQHSVLINSHFDSHPTSIGGSDGGINIAIMLEVLRKMSEEPQRPRNNVIFLFNGSKEAGLHASHGFMSKHPWADSCKVVINLDAYGAGHKLFLFEAAGNNPWWLMNYYNKVPHPYGSVFVEVFSAFRQWFPTDFRQFRDFGLVGYDMAFIDDGYRYHTRYDGFRNIPGGSFQHGGDNVLFLVTNLANFRRLSRTHREETISGKINHVYFDVFGMFMLSYTTTIECVINCVTIVCSVGVCLLGMYRLHILADWRRISLHTVLNIVATVGGWIISLVFVLLLSIILTVSGYSMRWYGHPWILVGMYILPILALSGMLFFIGDHHPLNFNVKCHIQAHSVRLTWTLVLLLGTVLFWKCVYVVMILVAFDTIAFLVIYVCDVQDDMRTWQLIYLIGIIMPSRYIMYLGLIFISTIMPVSGRSGPVWPFEVVLVLTTFMFAILLISPYEALVSAVRKVEYIQIWLWTLFLINLILALTPVGFPYNSDVVDPKPQRYEIKHVQSIEYDKKINGSEIKRKARYMLINQDVNSPEIVGAYVEELKRAERGDPYVTWIDVDDDSPEIPQKLELVVVSKDNSFEDVVRYNVSITGPDHLVVVFPPNSANTVEQILIEDKLYTFSNHEAITISHVCGKTLAPLQMSFDVKTTVEDHGAILIRIVVNGAFIHDNFEITPSFKEFLNQFPDWSELFAYVETQEIRWI